MPRKTFGLRDGLVPPRLFCWGCICLLSSILVLQLFIVGILLQRLTDSKRLPQVTPDTGFSPLSLQLIPRGGQIQGKIAYASQGNNKASKLLSVSQLVLGAAVGLQTKPVVVFLNSLQSTSACHVVLFVDAPPDQAGLQKQGVDLKRVTFEQIGSGSSLDIGVFRYKLFQDYVARNGLAQTSSSLLIADVDDVAFQSDPFAWASKHDTGVQVFTHDPGFQVASEPVTRGLLQQCFSSQATGGIMSTDLITSGFAIGKARDMELYLQTIVAGLTLPQNCLKPGTAQAVINLIARNPPGNLKMQVHDAYHGPVWTSSPALMKMSLDGQKMLRNLDGTPYVVLHKYSDFQDLLNALSSKYLKAEKREADCTTFDVVPGDMRGFDLSHVAMNTQTECCAACLGESRCGAFIFSALRKHCWLKSKGGHRGPANRGDDVMCGIAMAKAGFA